MSYEFYKVLHLLGLFLSFVALGAGLGHAVNGGTKETNTVRGLLGALHGVGLLVVLVAGFGMHAKLKIDGMPGWFLVKLALWALVGALVIVPNRKPELAKLTLLSLPVLGLVGAWLGIFKPF